ncbi:MAG TPA: pyruvate kinase [Synergistaceae bacterium]|nr:MAG: Pyruvate kinase [Synergistales bacterium 54_9]HAA47480.1 pyruvate kinase [Synergistaceae bacterium]
MKKVKIVCTLGPACEKQETLKEMVLSGMDVARLNFSHGTHETHGRHLENIRSLEKSLDRPIAAMIDTKGPEIRTGLLAGGEPLYLETQGEIRLTPDEADGTGGRVHVGYEPLLTEVQPGQSIFIDDGTIHLKAERVDGRDLVCRVIVGGQLGERKGVSIPGSLSALPILTEKDRDDVRWAVENELDYIALSFVRNRDDIMEARRVIEDLCGHLRIIAKIETRQAVENLESIAEVVDGMMVARGDLGVEIPLEDVPLVQKSIVDLCRSQGKPVIVATQMLDSMIRNPRATRAEASDVANAVLDGTDAVMLSGETASGAYPVEAVRTMAKIITRTEKDERFLSGRAVSYADINSVPDAVSHAAGLISQRMRTRAILSLTESGGTAQMVSKYRPNSIIIGSTPSRKTWRALTLVWGVVPLLARREETLEKALDTAMERAIDEGLLLEGDLIVVTAGVPVGMSGTTNTVEVVTVGQILVKGLSLLKKDATGRIVKAHTAEEANEKIREGDILVARQTDRDFIPAMKKAGAIVTEEGGLTSHAAIVALELRIPCIVGAEGALEVLEDDMIATVDGSRGVVFRGKAHLHSGR